ncbi:MAG: hypothetical protein LBJ20_05705 [Candidatus Methanoplasma sp.]|jgi:hypothetical protein|nr:hypothetical protein [Candidatus Methanoplasma sp.]
MKYESPKIVSEIVDEAPSVFVFPVLVAAGIFYTIAAVVQGVVAMETTAVAAVVLVAGAAVYVNKNSSC